MAPRRAVDQLPAHDRRAFLTCQQYVALISRQLPLRDDRSNLRLRIQRMTDLQRLHERTHAGGERIENAALDNEA